MKKKIALLVLSAAFVVNAAALTKVKLANGIVLEFEGCQDGSVRFEAKGKKAREPMNAVELKKTAAKENFIAASKNTYVWGDYQVDVGDEGYAFSFKGEKIYSSTFKDDGKLLKELRNWEKADEFYGFGEASRSVSLRNQSLTIYNESKYGDHAYVFVPFYVTNKNTAVYYNANGKDKIYFQNGKDAQLYRSEYHRIECFVRQDSSMKESIQKFYAETETCCMLPKWAYGYIQSKYGYKSAQEVVELVDSFKERNIPLSAVVLDLYWFEKMGDISAEKVREIQLMSFDTTSLETQIGDEGDTTLGDFVEDKNAISPEQYAYREQLKESLREVLSTLTEREENVIRMRFGLDNGQPMTLEEVGQKFGVTRERIRQIEAKAIRKLKHPTRLNKLASYNQN